jgi:hypothetical protein
MATINVDLQSSLPKAIAWTKTLSDQLPYATSLALNNTAFDMREDLNTATGSYFKTPNQFTQTAFYVQKSNKTDLTASVYAEANKGYDRARYLRFEIQGGERISKGFERKFLSEVVGTRRPPADTQLVPTSLVRTNANGDISLATIRRISAGLNTKGNGTFFVGYPKGGDRPFGIYRRSKGQLFPYFVALNHRARYKPLFPMATIGEATINRVFSTYLVSALDKAVASAR